MALADGGSGLRSPREDDRDLLSRNDKLALTGAAALCVLAGALVAAGASGVVRFIASAFALAALAFIVGRCIDQLGDRLGSGATGVLQSALGNLPELFVCIFALRAGLTEIVQAAIIGSILGNLLLVLGLAFVVGGRRHGRQRFDAGRARVMIALLLLSVAAMLVPSLASYVGSPAAAHERALSIVTSVVLLLVFAASVPASVRRSQGEVATEIEGVKGRWPLWLAITLLATAGVLAAVVSDWFVGALTPSLASLHISETFAGLVIVAIAGNAVEHVIGIQLAARNQPDFALSVILNSPLQIAIVLAPVLVLISPVVGGSDFTLVFPPLLVTTVAAAVLAVSFTIIDGESDELEGAALLGLYAVIATSFWWG